jgi:hypothetical protein
MEKPLSSLLSPVQQMFDSFWSVPLTTWQRFFNPQAAVNDTPAGAGVEESVLRRVDTHGKQLSALLDMVSLLRTRLLDVSQLDAQQRAIVDDVERLQAGSKLAAAASLDEPDQVSAEQVLTVLRALRQKDPGAYASLRARVLELGD